MFNYVADPIAAGAGTSDTAHLPNVTGVYLIGAYAQMMPIIKAFLPQCPRRSARSTCRPKINMVIAARAMQKAVATAAGMEVKAVAANSTTEVGDAALALIAQRHRRDLSDSGQPHGVGVSEHRAGGAPARMPVFVFQSSQVRGGRASLGVSRDYYDSGREAAALAARVMRGESPARDPVRGVRRARS